MIREQIDSQNERFEHELSQKYQKIEELRKMKAVVKTSMIETLNTKM